MLSSDYHHHAQLSTTLLNQSDLIFMIQPFLIKPSRNTFLIEFLRKNKKKKKTRIINCRVIFSTLKLSSLQSSKLLKAEGKISQQQNEKHYECETENFIESYCVKIADIPIHLINQIKDQRDENGISLSFSH